MNKRGFTLIELMAVVTVLAILSLIIIPIVDRNLKKSKDDLHKIQIENIRLAAKGYFSDHIDKRPINGRKCSILLSDLISNGYISSELVDPRTDEPFTGYSVQISNIGTDGKDVYSYHVCPEESACESSVQSCL